MSRFTPQGCLLAAVLAAACGKAKEPGAEPPPATATSAAISTEPCTPQPFADAATVPEASGAAWLTLHDKPALLVISDSGHSGAYAIVEADAGETLETGKLPLGAAGDDIEGLANRGDLIAGITSSGWIREWKRTEAGFELATPAYPLGPEDLPSKGGLGDKPPEGTGMVCGAKAVNCGRNYEGLCLSPPAHASGPCVGFAASKADGHLYCIVEDAGKLAVKFTPRIAIARPGVVADCAFSDDGTLYVGSNLFDMAQVYRVDGWTTPETAKVVPLAKLGIGFPETIAARGEVIYRMSDTGGSPSLMTKFRCTRR